MRNLNELTLCTYKKENFWEAFFYEYPDIFYGKAKIPEDAIAKMIYNGQISKINLASESKLNNNLSSISGRFTLRMDKSLHAKLLKESQRKNISLNTLVIQKILNDYKNDPFKFNWKLINFEILGQEILIKLISEEKPIKQVILKFSKYNFKNVLGILNNEKPLELFDMFSDLINEITNAMIKYVDKKIENGNFEKIEIKCYLINVKKKFSSYSVLSALKNLFGEEKALKYLEDWDDYIVLET